MDFREQNKYTREGKKFSQECVAYLREDFGLPDFTLEYEKYDWSEERRTSRGGFYPAGYGISIAMKQALFTEVSGYVYQAYEYRSFMQNKYIGGFLSDNPLDNLKLHITHEIAHAFQYYLRDKCEIAPKFFDAGGKINPHGKLFKYIYKTLRMKFVNPYLKDQEFLRKEYEAQKRQARRLAFGLEAYPEAKKTGKRFVRKGV